MGCEALYPVLFAVYLEAGLVHVNHLRGTYPPLYPIILGLQPLGYLVCGAQHSGRGSSAPGSA